jgi:hypothetical protein
MVLRNSFLALLEMLLKAPEMHAKSLIGKTKTSETCSLAYSKYS